MTTVEARVENPLANHAAAVDGVTDTDMVDAALKHEEDTMLRDEEIDSCEGEDLDDQMLTVALVKSVVDGTNQQPRYGLRKRRRPGDNSSTSSPESNSGKDVVKKIKPEDDVPAISQDETSRGDSAVGGKAEVQAKLDTRQPIPTPPITKASPDKPAEQQDIPGTQVVKGEAAPPPLIKQEVPPDIQQASAGGDTIAGTVTPKAEILLGQGSSVVSGQIATTIVKSEVIAALSPKAPVVAAPVAPSALIRKPPLAPVKIESKPVVAARPKKAPAAQTSTPRRAYASSVPTPLNPSVVTPKLKTAPSPAVEPTLKEELVPTSGAVPNPLSMGTPDPPSAVPSAYAITTVTNKTSVPYPLPSSVPCPLQPDAPDTPTEKKVTIAEPAVFQTRSRIFSVDLDRKYIFLLRFITPTKTCKANRVVSPWQRPHLTFRIWAGMTSLTMQRFQTPTRRRTHRTWLFSNESVPFRLSSSTLLGTNFCRQQ
jgi:hypothetical protein